jgi:aldehyde dehydrogenase (NAD+)
LDYSAGGIEQGAKLVCGGLAPPPGLDVGFYVAPTIFRGVSNDMSIAQEEIFGPVLSVIPYGDDNDAAKIANNSPYGLSAYLWTTSPARAEYFAAQVRAGNVHLNGAPYVLGAPFGGYKQSGNGREGGSFGLEEFLETKAVFGAMCAHEDGSR